MDETMSGGLDRLRLAGVGVISGGVLLGVGSIVFGLLVTAVLVIGLGVVVAISRQGERHWVQGGIGIAVVGAIGLVESVPGVGLGLDGMTIAVLAVVFGTLDIFISVIIHRFTRSRKK